MVFTGKNMSADALRRSLRGFLLRRDIPEGFTLPTVRELALQCGLHRNTVHRIYREFTEEGLLATRQGKGAWVIKKVMPEMRFLCIGREVNSFRERSDMFYRQEARKGILEMAAVLNCQIDFCEVHPKNVRQWSVEELAEYDGVALFTEGVEHSVLPYDLPIPTVSIMADRCSCLNMIRYNRKQAIRSAVTYLANKGYRKIGLVIGDLDRPNNQEKFAGYAEGMFNADLPVLSECVIRLGEKSGFFNVAGTLQRYLKENPLLEAYVCSGSNQASILLSCMRTMEINVPQDVAIIGYDEIDAKEDITQIILPRRKVAARALEWLVENAGHSVRGVIEELDTELRKGITA